MGKRKLTEYVENYIGYEARIKRSIEYAENLLNKIMSDLPEYRIREIIKDDKVVSFDLLDFKIELRFSINILKDQGYIYWYYIRFNPERREFEGILLIMDTFDHAGDIDAERSIISPPYWTMSLIKCLEKIDSLEVKTVDG
jgi:hypothetical protein